MDSDQDSANASNLPPKGHWILCYIGSITGIFFCVVALCVIPKFAAIFKELGLKLPIATRWVLDAHFMGIEYILILFLVANLLSERRHGTKTWKKAINIALLPACLVALGILTSSLFQPVIGIIDTLGPK